MNLYNNSSYFEFHSLNIHTISEVTFYNWKWNKNVRKNFVAKVHFSSAIIT